MSYSKALAFTAFGIGAFLQGCSEDDEDKKDVTDCATLTGYETLFSAESTAAADAECLACVSTQDDVDDDKADTDAAKDWAAAWAKIAAGPEDADRLIAGDALSACGAVRIATACAGVSVDLPSKDPAALQVAFITAATTATNFECIVSVQIGQPEALTCASIKKGITDSGGSASFDCDADYSCVPLVNYEGELDKDGNAVVAACSTCLDSQSGTGKTWSDLDSTDDAQFVTMVDALEHCGAQQQVDRCSSVDAFEANDLTYDTMSAVNNQDAECLLCANIDLESSPTCEDSKAAFENCGADVAAAVCDACADFDPAADTDCGKCLTAESYSAVKPTTMNVAAFVTSMLPFTTCQAAIADDAAICTKFEHEDVVTTTNTDAWFTELVADTSSNAPCLNCVYYHLATLRADASDAYTCDEVKGAIVACSADNVAHEYPTTCSFS